MNTRRKAPLVTLAAGLALVGLGTHSAGAQGQTPNSNLHFTFSTMTAKYSAVGTAVTLTLQGTVKLRRTDGGTLDMTAAPDGFTLQAGSSQGKSQIIKVPMDLATLKVSVTPAGTVFTDAKADSLTVQTAATPAP